MTGPVCLASLSRLADITTLFPLIRLWVRPTVLGFIGKGVVISILVSLKLQFRRRGEILILIRLAISYLACFVPLGVKIIILAASEPFYCSQTPDLPKVEKPLVL